MIKLVFQLLQHVVSSINGSPQVRWFAAQTDDNDEAVYYVPAVYIEFMPVTTAELPSPNLGSVLQEADITVRIHLMTDKTHPDDDNDVMDHLDLCDSIHKAISTTGTMKSAIPMHAALVNTLSDYHICNRFTRTGITTDHSQSSVIVTILEYSTHAVDTSAYVDNEKVTVTPTIFVTAEVK
jgi:hypothetical protein